jgi:hypothetical protein
MLSPSTQGTLVFLVPCHCVGSALATLLIESAGGFRNIHYVGRSVISTANSRTILNRIKDKGKFDKVLF